MIALFNGARAGVVAQSRGLQFGDGVFRTILIWNGQLLDWPLHLEKLSSDCAALQLKMPNSDLLRAEADQLALGHQRAVLKVLVMRQNEGRGYRSATEESDRLLLFQTAPHYPETHWTCGIDIFKCPLQLAHQPALAGLKHLNRLEQVLASRQWPAGMDEGILCDQSGKPVCGTRSNLFWVKNGEIHTPALDQCGVAGMMRGKIMRLIAQRQNNIFHAMKDWETLLNADEIFVCNSLIGIWPVRQLQQRQWPSPGVVTLSLQQAIGHPRLS
jgi:4-amino-4-deoxychorismate lyase